MARRSQGSAAAFARVIERESPAALDPLEVVGVATPSGALCGWRAILLADPVAAASKPGARP